MRVDRADVGLLAVRVMIGVVFVYHGAQKLFGAFGGGGIEGASKFFAAVGIPFPVANAWVASLTETFGGLALILGLATRLVSVPLAFTMAVAVWVLSANGFSGQGGFEFPLTLGVVLVGLALLGGGRLSLDQAIWGRMARRSESADLPAAAAVQS